METQGRALESVEGERIPLPNVQSTSEFNKFLSETIFALRLSVEQENASRGVFLLNFFKYHANDGRSIPCITGLKNSFSLSWRLPAAGSLEGFSLEATIWSGVLPSLDQFAFDKPRPETSRTLHLGWSIADGYAWIDPDGADELSSHALAEDLVAWYLDNGR